MRTDHCLGFLFLVSAIACNLSTEKDTDTGIPSGGRDAFPVVDRSILPSPDASVLPLADAAAIETASSPSDVAWDSGGDRLGTDTAISTSMPDGALTEAPIPDAQFSPDRYEPGSLVPIVVNSGNTAMFSLASGQWKRFSFPAEAGQIYSISEIVDPVFGYLSTSPDVSPKTYTQKSDAQGVLIFIAPTTQTYYLAVSVEGDNVLGVSGSFQVADGGKRLALGENSVLLTAPTGSDGHFFHFPITQGKSYQCVLSGTAKTSLGFSPAPRSERMSNGQPAWPLLGVGSGLPIREEIPSSSVAKSLSGFYYLYVNIHESMTLTISLTEK